MTWSREVEEEPAWGGKRNAIVGVIVGVAVLGLVFLVNQPLTSDDNFRAVQVGGKPAGEAPRLGAPAPDFKVLGLDGRVIRLSELRGKPVWLNFWATWCPPCRAEFPIMEELYREEGSGAKFTLLALSIGEDPATVRDFIKRLGYTVTVGLDTNMAVAAQYRLTGIPTHYFIDKDGVLRDFQIGAMNKQQMTKKLGKILPEGQ